MYSAAIIQPANIQTLHTTSLRCKHTTIITRLFIAGMLRATFLHAATHRGNGDDIHTTIPRGDARRASLQSQTYRSSHAIAVDTHGVRLRKTINRIMPKQSRRIELKIMTNKVFKMETGDHCKNGANYIFIKNYRRRTNGYCV